MLSMNKERKKRHPYATLAVFTLAAASMINITNKAKRFVKTKSEQVVDMFRHKMK